MTASFQFSRTPKIIFGNGGFSRLPSMIKQYGRRVILVTGKRSFEEGPHSKDLFQALETEYVEFRIVNIAGEPSPEMIDSAVSDLRPFRADAVAAIGGGSVMDAGKAISAMLKLEDQITDFLEDVGTREHPGTKVPFIAIPTTSGTGSEATKNAVISRTGRNGFKKSLRHDNFVPDIALIDPELTLNCPRDITAASGMDCFSQLTEAWLSTKANPYTDALALEGLKTIKSSLLECYENGGNPEARAGMSFAALTSGICLANAGLGAVHGFASSVGGLYEIPHGLICGTLMAVTNELTLRKLISNRSDSPALKKYAILGGLFLDVQKKSDEDQASAFIYFLHELTAKLNLPGLQKSGVQVKDIPEICRNTGMKNNPVKLDEAELTEILERRLI